MSQNKKQIRANFRKDVFERDKYTCRCCGFVALPGRVEDTLDAHHITDRSEMPSGGYVKENGISVCAECHKKAEKYHISEGKEWEPGFHPDELYAKIGSSHEKAVKASEKLRL